MDINFSCKLSSITINSLIDNIIGTACYLSYHIDINTDINDVWVENYTP